MLGNFTNKRVVIRPYVGNYQAPYEIYLLRQIYKYLICSLF